MLRCCRSRRRCPTGSAGFLIAATLVLLAPGASASTRFVDATQEAGLAYLQHTPPAPPACVVGSMACDVDRMSGGAATADVDGDGCPDLYVTRLDQPDLLFRNDCSGRFSDITTEAGLADFDLHSNGAIFGDIDNDGDADLFVTTVGDGTAPNDRFYLFLNDGRGVFIEDASARGAAVASTSPRLAFSAAFGDFDRDGWLDVIVTEWLASRHARLLRNRGAAAPGHFEDVTDVVGLSFDGVNGFAATFVDLDQDGWQDLAVAADFGTSRLFWNDRGVFTDGTQAAGVGTDENGMGSTFGDHDADGDLDWFVTSIFDPAETCEGGACIWGYTGNRLYRNNGDRTFEDATDAAGVRDGAWGWGTVFFDFDNDADLDLVMTNGIELLHTTIEDPFNADPMRLWENDGSGSMTEVSSTSGIDDTRSGKGLLTFDADADGDLDLFVVNNAGEPRFYRNELTGAARWLRLRVVGRASNREARGARVEVWRDLSEPPQVREVGVASHYLGQSEVTLHLGLGPGVERVPRVRVRFPSGRAVGWHALATNQLHVLVEPPVGCGLGGAEGALAVALLVRLRRRPR